MTATFFPVAFGLEGGDVALAKSSLGNGGFVLADSDRFVAREFQYARLLAKGRQMRPVNSGKSFVLFSI